MVMLGAGDVEMVRKVHAPKWWVGIDAFGTAGRDGLVAISANA